MKTIPIFAVVGHPNEGKSSVLSTLTEDDSVAVSAYPGETVNCQRFPVKINGELIMEFVDTPGFQNPTRTLQWMKASGKTDESLLDAFLSEFGNNPQYHHDCELMKPLKEGAAVIYVVDCSRPLLDVDKAEMEILRLINKPRMAVINFKETGGEYMEEWKLCFRRHFNVIREFNAHHARFDERLALLETLKAIHQDWEPALNCAIQSFRKDWEYRRIRVAEEIIGYLEWALNFRVDRSYARESESDRTKEKALNNYRETIINREQNLFKEIRRLYRHHLYHFSLPAQSILNEDLFSDKTWQLLGLTQKQLLIAATGMGAGIGAALDVAASGLTFGIFTAAGAITAAGGTLFKGKELSRIRIKHVPLGGTKVIIGPNRNPQFPFILLDRSILYHQVIANHAHGKRSESKHQSDQHGLVTALSSNMRVEISKHLKGLISSHPDQREKSRTNLLEVLQALII